MLKKTTLTEEFIRGHVSDESIFREYFGDKIEFNKSYPSIFRTDKNPSTGFYRTRDGNIIYNDLCTGEKCGSVKFVMKLYNLNYGQALRKIAQDFRLINNDGTLSNVKPIKKYSLPKEKEEKILTVDVQKYSELALNFWKQYYITEDELKENNVYFVKNFRVNGYLIPNEDNEIRYAYLAERNDKQYLKIYTPYSEKFKWVSNIPLNLPFGLNQLPFKDSKLIITKSQKDRIVMKKYFSDVIGLQNESASSLTEEDEIFLKSKYKEIYIFMDNDNAGKKAAEHYINKGFKNIVIPDRCRENFGVKDSADFIKHYGQNVFEVFLKHNKLI